ncbi:MAG: glycosyltransferase family 39 protein [Planctomycetota bacterium]
MKLGTLASGDRLALAAALLQAILLVAGAWRVGPTFDEHFYAASGVAYLEEGEFGLNREHPPLIKYLVGAPLVLAGAEMPDNALLSRNFPVAFFYQRHGDDLDRNLFLARLPVCLLTLATTALVFFEARRRFGPGAGAGAVVLFGLSPSVLAHGRLVSLDAGVMPFLFAAVLAFLAALERPSWGRTLLAAVLFGLAHLAKLTALMLGPAFVGLACFAALRGRSLRPLATLVLTLFGGLGVFAAGYGFEAKSINAAWGSDFYVRDIPPRAVAPDELAAALADAGADAAQCARVGDAPSLAAAVQLLVGGLASPASAPRAAAGLRALEGGPGELRTGAFEAVLSLPPERLAADERHRTLAALAGRSAPDDAGWRRLFEDTRGESWDRTIFYHGWMKTLTSGIFGDARPIPLLSSLKGLDQTLAHGKIGHGSYFRGRTLLPGRDFGEGNPHPEYYAVVMGIKNPLGALALFALGLVLGFVPLRKAEGAPGWTLLSALALLGMPLALFYAFSTGKALLGVRYLLPLYPFLAVLAARAFAALPKVAWPLALLALVESAWIHPDELMYYNLLGGGPRGGPRISVVGDDWGQDARAVGRWYARYRDEVDAAGGLVYRPYTMADPAAFGLEHARPHGGPTEAIVAVHAVDYYREAEEFAWLRDYEPFLNIGHAVYVYDTRGGAPGRDPRAEWEASR